MTRDYKRNGTTTLFAAIDVLSRSLIRECLPPPPPHRVPEVPADGRPRSSDGLQIHLILDNYVGDPIIRYSCYRDMRPCEHHFSGRCLTVSALGVASVEMLTEAPLQPTANC
jgi:hypothetical protein